jgi:hypothetical protein
MSHACNAAKGAVTVSIAVTAPFAANLVRTGLPAAIGQAVGLGDIQNVRHSPRLVVA